MSKKLPPPLPIDDEVICGDTTEERLLAGLSKAAKVLGSRFGCCCCCGSGGTIVAVDVKLNPLNASSKEDFVGAA